jgi:ATP sulfurylase
MSNNKSLYIDTEALSTLALVQAGLLSPLDKLMNSKEAQEADETKFYKGVPFPFAFVLAPIGEKNDNVLKTLKQGETIDLINHDKKVGELIVDETFPIDPKQRLYNIYGTSDPSHPGVKNTTLRLGNIAVSGEYTVAYPLITDNIKRIQKMITKTGAKFISSMMLAANPFNRAHERMIRQAISDSDLLIIFLRKPFTTELGLYYDKNRLNSVFDHCKDIDIDIKTVDEYVYCDTCNTLVSTSTCPHGQHHHVHYHSEAIMKLIQSGVIPPSILVRKEVSANILAALFPERFENLQELYYSLMPGSGLLEQQSEEQFYLKLMELYQTSSLT